MTIRFSRHAVAFLLALVGLAPLAAAQSTALTDAFDALERVEMDPATDAPIFLAGDLGIVSPATAPQFFIAHAAAFGFSTAPDVQVTRVDTDDLGLTHVRVHQMVDGTPVWGAESALHIGRDGRAYAWGGTLLPDADVARGVDLGRSAALAAARADLGAVRYRESAPADALGEPIDWTPTAEAVVFPHLGDFARAYHVRLFVDAPTPANWEVFVDAASGTVLHKFNSLHTAGLGADEATARVASGAPFVTAAGAAGPTTGTGTSLYEGTKTIPTYLSGSNYYLYDTTRGPSYIRTMTGNNGTSLPGSYVTDADNNFSATNQRAAVSAHYGAVTTFDYYKNTHNRSSYNGSNASITSTVNHQSNYNNAFWNGAQMVYGDGDGVTFSPLVELDIVAHELTHAVTGSSAGLIYQNESGALNEAVSDIMAVMVDRNDYTVGEQSYTPGTSGDALRNIQNPPAGDQPDNYADRYTGTGDNGGVHINSGIANKQAYLMIAGGTFRGVTTTSIGRSATEKIWYRALTVYFTQSTNFAGARQGTLSAAADLYGNGSTQYNAVADAWAAVGVGTGSGGGTPPPTGGTPEWRYETANIQSPHNYPNNYNNTQSYSKPGAQRVAMYFAQFDTEANYDYVYIKDENGTTQATYTGNKAAFWAVVDGASISANLVTDYSVQRYGYRITQVAYFSDQVLLAQDTNPVLGYVPQAPESDVLNPLALGKAEVAELALAVGPNPARSEATILVDMPEAGSARVVVLDLLGREVSVPHNGTLDAGRTPVSIAVETLPAGVYVVVLDTDGRRLTERFTVVR
ncbi:M4 family metallopeptidase [Rubrivirga sp. IMCC43871]|uniref:M4 family metallopeptidase n=1 Tax=Rubrivirga sp. IMCC43871 TaxID=3391575 RepID=UPI00399011DD